MQALLIPLLSMLMPIPTSNEARCAYLRVEPTAATVAAGSSIGFIIAVGNCSDKPTRFEIEIEVESACGEVVGLPDGYLRLRSGAGGGANTVYNVPADACPGTYHIAVKVLVGQTVVVTEKAEFMVIN